jgi:type IV secretory pathway VirB10-like protein
MARLLRRLGWGRPEAGRKGLKKEGANHTPKSSYAIPKGTPIDCILAG